MARIRKTTIGRVPKRLQLLEIYQMIKSRINFRYGFSDTIKFLCWELSRCTRCRSEKSRNSLRLPYKERKFAKASGRLLGEIDIVRLISILRNFEIVKRAILSSRERVFIPLQRNQVISSDDDCSPDDYEELDCVRDNFDTNKKSTDEGEQFFERLRDMLLSFEGDPLTMQSRRIIDGIKSKRLVHTDDKLINDELEKNFKKDADKGKRLSVMRALNFTNLLP